jgi:sec-independent protein translocase protein TatA
MPGPFELLIIAGLGLLMFGRRLPDVAKGLGRSVVEFKKGLREVTDDIDSSGTPPKPPTSNPPAA